MASKVTLRKVGSSFGFTVPRDIVIELDLAEGREFYVVSTPDGILLTTCEPPFEKAMKASMDFMRRYPNAMKALANT